jgi:cell wall-associated NlpC family hydrolase
LLGILAALLSAVPAVADPSVPSKQAEAQRVLVDIQRLDMQMEKAVEAYNLANLKLAKLKHDLRENEQALAVARGNLKKGQRTLARRLVALYVSDATNTTLEVMLGSKSLDDMLNRLEAVSRVSSQDTHVLGEVRQFRTAVQEREGRLKKAHEAQASLVDERARQRAAIDSQLAQRRAMLSSIKSEIAKIQAAERSRQLQIAASARARLANRQDMGAEDSVVGAAATTAEGISVAPPSQYSGVVGVAMQYLGTPYVWGGAAPGGFDCSGFVMYAYSQVGVSLPHNAAAQFGAGVPISKDQLQPGDIVFFDGLGHDGLYIGGGQFVHAPHTGDVVKISSLSESWYASAYVGARRIL